MTWTKTLRRHFLAGLFVLLPAWGTYLILSTLFTTLDGLISDVLGPTGNAEIPGLGLATLVLIIMLAGVVATEVVGQRLVTLAEGWLTRIPVVRTIYVTLKGMTDLFKFRERFGRSTVVVFPFPRDGLWALGFVMGLAPPALQVLPAVPLIMVFVPTAIHPFTGYLAFVPKGNLHPVTLPPEDAMKMEFSAGLFRPHTAWLTSSRESAES